MRVLIAAPLLLLLVLFALSNPQIVHIGLWPTDFALEAPLSLTVLMAMGVAFLLGGLMLWVSAIGARRRARRAEYAARLLEAQVQELKARLDRPLRPGMATPDMAGPALPPPS
ncbi:LapA family protein [Limobrevibacterium gyesilva]|uniref:LapA family protein n=1 Tax=Limobrevibacterium gyesilva TaxID=2991712 RepID=A0AA41YWW3_9PROT|nr:LapA family protein [Limobrevibacterium gyesilva]MCW3477865.1 LapA family protein [Limobrevibacterium gyesilva]